MLEEKLNADVNTNSMNIYSLKYSKDNFGKKKINPTRKRKLASNELRDINDELIKSTLDYIKQYTKLISEGKFNLTKIENKEEKACKYCEFKSVCRIQEVSL
jgi:ATP-dependent helicase/DNAse subunit B